MSRREGSSARQNSHGRYEGDTYRPDYEDKRNEERRPSNSARKSLPPHSLPQKPAGLALPVTTMSVPKGSPHSLLTTIQPDEQVTTRSDISTNEVFDPRKRRAVGTPSNLPHDDHIKENTLITTDNSAPTDIPSDNPLLLYLLAVSKQSEILRQIDSEHEKLQRQLTELSAKKETYGDYNDLHSLLQTGVDAQQNRIQDLEKQRNRLSEDEQKHLRSMPPDLGNLFKGIIPQSTHIQVASAAQNLDLKTQLQTVLSEVGQLKQNQSNQNNTMVQLETHLKESNTHIKLLQEQISEAKTLVTEQGKLIDSQSQTILRLTQNSDQYSDELEIIRNTIKDHKLKLADIGNHFVSKEDFKDCQKEYDSQLNELRTAASSTTTRFDTFDKSSTAIGARLNTVEIASEDQNVALEHLKTLRTDINRVDHSIQSLNSRYNAISTQSLYMQIVAKIAPYGPQTVALQDAQKSLHNEVRSLEEHNKQNENGTSMMLKERLDVFEKKHFDDFALLGSNVQMANEAIAKLKGVSSDLADLKANYTVVTQTSDNLGQRVKVIKDKEYEALVRTLTEECAHNKNTCDERYHESVLSRNICDQRQQEIDSQEGRFEGLQEEVQKLHNLEVRMEQIGKAVQGLEMAPEIVVIDISQLTSSMKHKWRICQRLRPYKVYDVYFEGGRLPGSRVTTLHAAVIVNKADVKDIIAKKNNENWNGRIIKIIQIPDADTLNQLKRVSSSNADTSTPTTVKFEAANTSEDTPSIRITSATTALASRQRDMTSGRSTPTEAEKITTLAPGSTASRPLAVDDGENDEEEDDTIELAIPDTPDPFRNGGIDFTEWQRKDLVTALAKNSHGSESGSSSSRKSGARRSNSKKRGSEHLSRGNSLNESNSKRGKQK